MHTKALDYAAFGIAVARQTADSARFTAVNDDDKHHRRVELENREVGSR